tara:strand:- start:22970 stop:23368 length:399 start_codon:yes stop_codon:yes gene_type:complete
MITDAETAMLAEITAIVSDLHSSGTSDGQTMFMLGAGADRLCATRIAQTWTGFKRMLGTPDLIPLLKQLDAEGTAALRAEQGRQAYALRALALSLAAVNVKQDITKAGAALLDTVIEAAMTNYRTNAKPAQG